MALFGASGLRAELDWYKMASIVGVKRSGKDLLACELAQPYVRAGYKFYSNQFNVWNDNLYISYDVYISWRRKIGFRDNVPEPANGEMMPDVLHRVIVLSEAGIYLRKYEYFQNLFAFAGKMEQIYLFPSTRPSHADLMTLKIFPILPFKQLFGIEGGFWGYTVETGFSRPKSGKFLFWPGMEWIGVYDTKDYTESPDVLLSAIEKEIDIDQKSRARDGIYKVAGVASGVDADFQATIEARAYQRALALSDKRR